jgi:hypothetical protein
MSDVKSLVEITKEANQLELMLIESGGAVSYTHLRAHETN